MIFGDSKEVQEVNEQKLIKRKIFGDRKFAWTPKQLEDGRKVWLQFYYGYQFGYTYDNDKYSLYNSDKPRLYVEHSAIYVQIRNNHSYEYLKLEEVQTLFDRWKTKC